MLKKIFKIFKNRYVFTTAAFLIWICIFDKNNLISQIELTKKLHKLKNDRLFYTEQIKHDKKETKELLTNPESIEKFAREKYLMKRDSEDIFLIIRSDSLPKTTH